MFKNSRSNLSPRQDSVQQLTSINHLESPEDSSPALIQHLVLDYYKVMPCQNQILHSHKQCQFYHSEKDRRRMNSNYSGEMCQFVSEAEPLVSCPNGNFCQFAHNKVEQLYQPDKYKTKFCTLYPQNCANCEYGAFCSFAHSQSEIKIELLHNLTFDCDFYIFLYKTVSCPFNYINHDRGKCVYAHNLQDFRRKPSAFSYEPVPCNY